jgi:hypothetical protein
MRIIKKNPNRNAWLVRLGQVRSRREIKQKGIPCRNKRTPTYPRVKAGIFSLFLLLGNDAGTIMLVCIVHQFFKPHLPVLGTIDRLPLEAEQKYKMMDGL